MIRTNFKDLLEIPGIESVMLVDHHNNLIDTWAAPSSNPAIFKEVAETYLHIFTLMEHLHYQVDEICMPFDRGIVFARSHPRYNLIIIGKSSLQIPLLRIFCDVCQKDMDEHRKSKKALKKLPEKQLTRIDSRALDDVEKIMLENILEEHNRAR